MNIGDYVRTKDGLTFGKITDIMIDNLITWYEINGKKTSCWKGYFKSSPNIIDLIEVGDYVNGERVIYKQYKEYPNPNLNHYIIDTTKDSKCNEDIKSIVTKEQFTSMEYKLGDKQI